MAVRSKVREHELSNGTQWNGVPCIRQLGASTDATPLRCVAHNERACAFSSGLFKKVLGVLPACDSANSCSTTSLRAGTAALLYKRYDFRSKVREHELSNGTQWNGVPCIRQLGASTNATPLRCVAHYERACAFSFGLFKKYWASCLRAIRQTHALRPHYEPGRLFSHINGSIADDRLSTIGNPQSRILNLESESRITV